MYKMSKMQKLGAQERYKLRTRTPEAVAFAIQKVKLMKLRHQSGRTRSWGKPPLRQAVKAVNRIRLPCGTDPQFDTVSRSGPRGHSRVMNLTMSINTQ